MYLVVGVHSLLNEIQYCQNDRSVTKTGIKGGGGGGAGDFLGGRM